MVLWLLSNGRAGRNSALGGIFDERGPEWLQRLLLNLFKNQTCAVHTYHSEFVCYIPVGGRWCYHQRFRHESLQRMRTLANTAAIGQAQKNWLKHKSRRTTSFWSGRFTPTNYLRRVSQALLAALTVARKSASRIDS